MAEIKISGVTDWFKIGELSTPMFISTKHRPYDNHIPRTACPAPQFYGRGMRWTDGAPVYTSVMTVLPPNDTNATNRKCGDSVRDGIYSAGSYHSSSVHVLFVDGSIHLISDSIDTGSLAAPAPAGSSKGKSPYGVWGSLGTIEGAELVDAKVIK